MANWAAGNHNPHKSGRRTHLLYLLIRIIFCHVSKNLSRHCLFYVTVNIYFFFYFDSARDVITGLLIFVDIYHFNYTFSHAYTEAHALKHTSMISTQEEWRQPDTGAWLGGVEEMFLSETKA